MTVAGPSLARPHSPAAIDLLILYCAAAAMTCWTWATWPDPLVDWGTQLYLAWRISAGQMPYRDIAYFNGPLSIFFNAALFKIFSVNQRVLWCANLAIFALILAMLYFMLRRLGGRIIAVTGGVVFLAVFGFGRYVVNGNYNYVTPYMQEMTHGLAARPGGDLRAGRFQMTARLRWAALAGLTLGLCFLTKPELFIAGFLAAAVGFALHFGSHKSERRASAVWGVLIATIILPPMAAALLLRMKMPWPLALHGVAGAWPWVLDRRVANMSFYRWVAGTDDVRGNLLLILKWAAIHAVIFACAAAIALRRCHCAIVRRDIFIFAVGSAFVLGAASYLSAVSWSDAFRPLPLWMAALCIAALVVFFRRPTSDDRMILRITMLVFSGLLLAKIALAARIWHYGFVLAMPAMLMLIETGVGWIPQELSRRGRCGAHFMGMFLGILAVVVGAHLLWQSRSIQDSTVSIGQGADACLVPQLRGQEVKEMLADVDHFVGPDQTMAVVPQGLMINYLSRRTSPVRFVNLMEPEVVTTGEQMVLDNWRQHPPDFVILSRADVTASGFRLHNDIYGSHLLEWITQNYQPILHTRGALGLTLARRTAR